jgi:short-subunit dehydrogenase
MQKPICLITGGTEGVGRATAIALAKKGFTVVLAARNASKAEGVKQEIAKAAGNTDVFDLSREGGADVRVSRDVP